MAIGGFVLCGMEASLEAASSVGGFDGDCDFALVVSLDVKLPGIATDFTVLDELSFDVGLNPDLEHFEAEGALDFERVTHRWFVVLY